MHGFLPLVHDIFAWSLPANRLERFQKFLAGSFVRNSWFAERTIFGLRRFLKLRYHFNRRNSRKSTVFPATFFNQAESIADSGNVRIQDDQTDVFGCSGVPSDTVCCLATEQWIYFRVFCSISRFLMQECFTMRFFDKLESWFKFSAFLPMFW